jgi:hypothetical protein
VAEKAGEKEAEKLRVAASQRRIVLGVVVLGGFSARCCHP